MVSVARSFALVLAIGAGAPVMGQWSTETLSSARSSLAATTVGSKAMFAGGSDVVDIYDDATDTWSTATLSQARSYLSATTVGSKAIFAGGSGSDVVDIYDDATDTWSAATLSQARARLSATTVGTKAIFAGGSGSDVVDIYDDATGAWSTATLSQARSLMGATAVGTKAIFAGGYAGNPSDVVDIYDDATGVWSTATLSQARSWLSATTIGTKAMFAGGSPGGPPLSDVVDVYDDATGQWSTMTLSVGRYALAATTVGDRAIFAAGVVEFVEGCPTGTVDVYDDATGTWSTAWIQPRRQLAATTVGIKALFAGGEGYLEGHPGCGSQLTTALVDVYDLDFGERYCSPALPNSTGLAGVTMAFGTTRVASNDLSLVATQLPPGELGYFIAGQTQGLFNPAGSQGVICLAGNIARFKNDLIQGPMGSIQIDLGAMPVNPPAAVLAGETWSFQAWHLDIGNTSNFTDSLSLTFQ